MTVLPYTITAQPNPLENSEDKNLSEAVLESDNVTEDDAPADKNEVVLESNNITEDDAPADKNSDLSEQQPSETGISDSEREEVENDAPTP